MFHFEPRHQVARHDQTERDLHRKLEEIYQPPGRVVAWVFKTVWRVIEPPLYVLVWAFVYPVRAFLALIVLTFGLAVIASVFTDGDSGSNYADCMLAAERGFASASGCVRAYGSGDQQRAIAAQDRFDAAATRARIREEARR